MAEVEEETELGRRALRQHATLRQLAAELQLLICLHETDDVRKEPLAVVYILAEIGVEHSQAGEEIIDGDSRPDLWFEGTAILDALRRLSREEEDGPASSGPGTHDYVLLLQLGERFVEADELDVRAPYICREVVLVASVHCVVLGDESQKDRSFRTDSEVGCHPGYIPREGYHRLFGKAATLDGLIDMVECCREGVELNAALEKLLVVSSSHDDSGLYIHLYLLRFAQILSKKSSYRFCGKGKGRCIMYRRILRRVEHDVAHHLLHNAAQGPGAGAQTGGLVRDGKECIVLYAEVDAVLAEQLLILAHDGVLRLGEDAQQCGPVQRIHVRDYGEAADELGDHAELAEVLRSNVLEMRTFLGLLAFMEADAVAVAAHAAVDYAVQANESAGEDEEDVLSVHVEQ